MGREAKRDHGPLSSERTSSPAPFDAARFAQDVQAATARVFRFDVVEPHPAEPRRLARALVAGALVGAAVLVAALVRSLVVRTALPLVLAAAAIVVLARSHVLGRLFERRSFVRGSRRRAAATTAVRWVAFDGRRLVYHGATGDQQLVATSAPFGVTLVANRSRQRVVAAVSSADGAFFIGSSFDASARRSFAGQLARASTVSTDEAALAALGPDGEALDLSPSDWVTLVNQLVSASPSCLDRVVLSDTRGAPVLLEPQELRVRDVRFDLTSPLEWRALLFQEPFGQAVAVYQGTWVRQGTTEVFLIALLPFVSAHSAQEGDASGIAELDRAALRDLRLMQASPEPPPPSNQRVAIERLFMLPLRAALDRAPRPSQQSSHARA